ncbi:MAG: sensor histidine kinase [Hyphomonadaceae bacterium]
MSAEPASTPENLWRRLSRAIRLSMAARLAVVALVATFVLIAVAFTAHALFSRQLQGLLIDPELSSAIDHLMANAAPEIGGEIGLRDAPFDPRYLQPGSGYYYEIARVDQGFDVQHRSGSLYDVTIAFTPEQIAQLMAPAADGAVIVRYLDLDEGPDGWPLRVAGRTAQIPDLEGSYLFIVANAPSVTLGPARDLVAAAFSAFIALCVAAVAAVALLQVHFGLEPLRKLQRDIAAVRRGQAESLTGDYAAELTPLANELNALVSHNREVVERARRHVGNLAHALKTPIAVLKNAAEDGGASGPMLKTTVSEMERFVERQLRRARVAARAEARAGVEAGSIGYRTPVKQNLEDLIFMMEQRYEHEKALDISLEAPSDVTFRGEREDLLEMAANLVDNACKYGKSQVIVRVTPPQTPGGLFEISVEDDGEGLTEEKIALVMQRGARLDEAAPGQGLGLSILSEAVALYAGELIFERASLGGLKARLRLPATD